MNNSSTVNPKKSRKGLILAGSLVVVGTVAALCLMGNRNSTLSTLNLHAEGGDLESEQAFMHFLASYGKTYSSKSHMNTRYQNFVDNFRAINEHNSQKLDYEMGINQFSDMTLEEFTTNYHVEGLAMPTLEARQQPFKHPHLEAAKPKPKEGLPDKVDWREAGKVTKP